MDYSQCLNQNLDFFRFQKLVFKNGKKSDLGVVSQWQRGSCDWKLLKDFL